MYGLPRTHEKDVPLCPILFMVGSSQHSLAEWLTSVFEPILLLYSSHCISDSFTFVDSLCNSTLQADFVCLCSFDVPVFSPMFHSRKPSTSVPVLYKW